MKKLILLTTLLLFAAGSAAVAEITAEDVSKVDLSHQSTLKFKNLPQYQSYLQNGEDTEMTEYGGSVPHEKHNNVDPLPEGYKHAQPYLKNLWMGYPFSYQYDRARGHVYALDDVFKIDRINRYSEKAGLPATCINCKTNTIPDFVNAFGDDFWSSEFHHYRPVHDGKMNSIGCTNCHDQENNMRLAITSFPLDEALKRQGKDWREASRDEMRSLVCAQCHVEYYFETGVHGVAAKPHFPWDDGMNPEQMWEFYSSGEPDPDGFKGDFVDWTHAVSKTPMLKTQHPEYEMYHDSIHGANGVSCADCHMPRIKSGPATISSHHWTSPLKDETMSACMNCHGDKTPGFMKERVLYHQEKVWKQLNIAQEKSVRAHEAVRMAMEYPELALPNETIIKEAQELVRKGQWFWDYVSAENSAGFHNPSKALETLALSQQYSDEATQLAIRATDYAIAKDLDKPIAELVPPIMEHSRKLQQSQAHLDSHPWLGYLPLLPEADLIWNGYEKVK
ncbi:MAG: ammonia-forming cytochrome c nitrite reductase subunit c552 [Pelovirga sp.]